MKKITILILIVLMAVISCKGKQNPKDKGLPGTEGAEGNTPELNVTVQEAKVITGLDAIYNDVKTMPANWNSDNKLLRSVDSIRSGVLITRLGSKFLVLRVNDKGNVNIGLETLLADAIDKSGKDENWDPRKFVYQFEPTATKNSVSDNGLQVNVNGTPDSIKNTYDRVVIVWSGRVSVGSDLKTYDNYKYALNGAESYAALRPYVRINYRDLSLSPSIATLEQAALNPAPIIGNTIDNSAHFFIEKDPHALGGKRAWSYMTAYMGANGKGNTQVTFPHMFRFGDSVNVDAADLYLSGIGPIVSSKIVPASTVVNASDAVDARAPSGKAVLRRLESGNKAYLFFSTVVGYNVRTQAYSGDLDAFQDKDGNNIPADRLLDVIVEFDKDSFGDAQADNWISVYDIPKYADEFDTELEASGIRNTYKVPFVFIKGE